MSPDVHNRAKLAETMTARGQPISVHGVDAWFKHPDSNYAIERESLDPHHPSYALPKGRWETLFDLFSLPPESLDREDADFRRWCFSEARGRRQKPVQPASRGGRLACCFDPRDVDFVAEDRPWFHSELFEVIELSAQSNHSDWSVARALKGVEAVVVYTSQNFATWPLLQELEGVLEQHRLPSVAVACDGYKDSLLGLERYSRRTGEHRAAITAIFREKTAVQALVERTGPAWQPPELYLYTARPSIAVLPFANFAGGQEFDELAEALAEDITSMLSRVPELFVVSTSTTRTYRAQLPDSRVVRDELGVRYVLEGSIRRGAGSGLRVTAQLVDAVQRNGLWAQRFERETEDLLLVQDELAVAICAQLEPRIRLSDMQLGASLKSTPAWRLFGRRAGTGFLWMRQSRDQNGRYGYFSRRWILISITRWRMPGCPSPPARLLFGAGWGLRHCLRHASMQSSPVSFCLAMPLSDTHSECSASLPETALKRSSTISVRLWIKNRATRCTTVSSAICWRTSAEHARVLIVVSTRCASLLRILASRFFVTCSATLTSRKESTNGVLNRSRVVCAFQKPILCG